MAKKQARVRVTEQQKARRALADTIYHRYITARDENGKPPTLKAAAREHGVTYRTLRNWAKEDEVVADMHRAAVAMTSERLSEDRQNRTYAAIEQLLTGYYCEEEDAISRPALRKDGTPRMKDGRVVMKLDRVVVRRRFVPPSPTIVAMCARRFLGFDGKAVQTAITVRDDEEDNTLTPEQLYALAFAFTAKKKESPSPEERNADRT